MTPSLLAVNAGSATLKFRVYSLDASKLVISGIIDRFGEKEISTLALTDARGLPLEERHVQEDGKEAAVAAMLETLACHHIEMAVVVHRVVHGGPRYTAPQVITPQVRQELEKFYNSWPRCISRSAWP